MNLFGVLEINASGLKAQRQRAEVVAANLANAETTLTTEGGPYRRRHVVFHAEVPRFSDLLSSRVREGVAGVAVREVVEDSSAALRRYEPGHPDADASGYVSYPAINPAEELVDLMGAARSYQLNVSAASACKQMIQQSLEILR